MAATPYFKDSLVGGRQTPQPVPGAPVQKRSLDNVFSKHKGGRDKEMLSGFPQKMMSREKRDESSHMQLFGIPRVTRVL